MGVTEQPDWMQMRWVTQTNPGFATASDELVKLSGVSGVSPNVFVLRDLEYEFVLKNNKK